MSYITAIQTYRRILIAMHSDNGAHPKLDDLKLSDNDMNRISRSMR